MAEKIKARKLPDPFELDNIKLNGIYNDGRAIYHQVARISTKMHRLKLVADSCCSHCCIKLFDKRARNSF